MLYVKQSLTKGEDIISMGLFHWMYTVQAAFWIVIGVVIATAILWGGVQLQLMNDVADNYANLPVQLVPDAKREIVNARGGWFGMVVSLHPGIKMGAFGMIIFGVFSFARMMVYKATTEICITNNRLIIKTGLIARHIHEMSVDRIEGVNVFQGILGRIFGYGSLVVRGMGVGEIDIPPIANPIAFRKFIEKSKKV